MAVIRGCALVVGSIFSWWVDGHVISQKYADGTPLTAHSKPDHWSNELTPRVGNTSIIFAIFAIFVISSADIFLMVLHGTWVIYW